MVDKIMGQKLEQGQAVENEWIRAHEELSRLAKARASLDAEEGRWLLCALRAGTHLNLGFASFAEYVEHLFGYRPRSTEEKLRVAEALEALPETERALSSGSASWSAVRELTRVATPQTEGEWLAATSGRTVRQIEQLVSTRAPGDKPSSPPGKSKRRHVLHFEVEAETLATFREAVAKLRRTAGGPSIDDDAVLLMMARQVLGGPTDAGRASYQVAVTVCEECSRGFQQTGGELLALEPEVLEMTECDAQHLGSVTATSAHVGATKRNSAPESARAPAKPLRAKQDIPPAVRRSVMRRDRGCCVVPGCKHCHFVDVHHLSARVDGGAHEPDNLVVLCGAHHRALHRGQLLVEGRASTKLIFRHADGTAYGQGPSPQSADAHARVFFALCKMGFRESEARQALKHVRALTQNCERIALLEA